MESTAHQGNASSAFEERMAHAVGQLRSAFTEIIDTLECPITRPSELQRELGIDKILGWRVYKLVRDADPFAAARHIPGAAGVRVFLRAAEKKGVSSALAEKAVAAVAEYERLACLHAGSRKRMGMMLAVHSEDGRAEAELAHRRLAYEANGFIWGASAVTQLRTTMLGFSQASGRMDCVTLGGVIGLQRLRTNLRWPLAKAMCTNDVGDKRLEFPIEPLYDVQNPGEVEEKLFMSQPRPQIDCRRAGRTLVWELLPGMVGRTGAVNCVTAQVMRRFSSFHRDEDNTEVTYIARIHTPSQWLIADHFIHRGLFGRVEPSVVMHSNIVDGHHEKTYHLPFMESVQSMGRATTVLHTPEVPRYTGMIAYAFDRMGWDPSEFDVYRLRMEYPVMLSELWVSHPIPE